MSDKITVDDCRKLLNDEFENDLAFTQINAIADLSVEKQFALARELARELSFCYESSIQSQPGNAKKQLNYFQSKVINCLVRSFEIYAEISREEYATLMAADDLYIIIGSLIKNGSFPVNFIVETSWLDKYTNHPRHWALVLYMKKLRNDRRTEIVAYCRNFVANSEHMSDEMILSIAGVTFNKL